jgi:hypothetical protein
VVEPSGAGGGGQQRRLSSYGLGGGSFERGFIAGEVRGGLGGGSGRTTKGHMAAHE